jgi:tripartite-type tricarboxylate transporter receptor subunit TctC
VLAPASYRVRRAANIAGEANVEWRNRALPAGIAALLIAGAALPAIAQTWPARPVRVVTTQPGSSAELMGRLIAPGLSSALGQQVLIDNRGLVAAEVAARAPADGYTILLYTSPLWVAPFFRDVAWDPVRDYAPVTLAAGSPNLLTVHPSLPVKSVKDLIALARARPGELNYGSGSTGASPHLSAELFKSMAGVNLMRVAFKGTGQALVAVMSGELQVLFPTAGSGMPYVKTGKLRALAVTTLQPTGLAPGLPTMTSLGLTGYESVSLSGFLAPAKTPAAIVDRLSQEIIRMLKRNDIREKLFAMGLEVVAGNPEQFAATIRREMAKWGKLIKDAGLRE